MTRHHSLRKQKKNSGYYILYRQEIVLPRACVAFFCDVCVWNWKCEERARAK